MAWRASSTPEHATDLPRALWHSFCIDQCKKAFLEQNMTVFWRFLGFCVVTAAAMNHAAALARANQPLEDIMDIARDVATTAAIATAGCLKSASSTSIDEIFSPPEIIISLDRSFSWT